MGIKLARKASEEQKAIVSANKKIKELQNSLAQAQSDLTDAQLLAAQQATDNAALTQSVTDLQVLMATNTTGGVA